MAETQPLFPNKFLRFIFISPFILLWKMVSWLCNGIGILLSLILAIALLGAGYLLISTILGFVFGHNLPSVRLLESLGFDSWGQLPEIAELDGVKRDLVILGKRLE